MIILILILENAWWCLRICLKVVACRRIRWWQICRLCCFSGRRLHIILVSLITSEHVSWLVFTILHHLRQSSLLHRWLDSILDVMRKSECCVVDIGDYGPKFMAQSVRISFEPRAKRTAEKIFAREQLARSMIDLNVSLALQRAPTLERHWSTQQPEFWAHKLHKRPFLLSCKLLWGHFNQLDWTDLIHLRARATMAKQTGSRRRSPAQSVRQLAAHTPTRIAKRNRKASSSEPSEWWSSKADPSAWLGMLEMVQSTTFDLLVSWEERAQFAHRICYCCCCYCSHHLINFDWLCDRVEWLSTALHWIITMKRDLDHRLFPPRSKFRVRGVLTRSHIILFWLVI